MNTCRIYKWEKDSSGNEEYFLTINEKNVDRRIKLIKYGVWVAFIPADDMARIPPRSYFFSTPIDAMAFCERNFESVQEGNNKMDWSKSERIILQ